MFYSRLFLNLRSRAARRDIGDTFEMHRTVMSAFPQLTQRQRSNPESGSILWRVDHEERHGLTMLIVQSQVMPDWNPLLRRESDYVAPPPGTELSPLETKERTLLFSSGQVLSFRLRANPTKKQKADGRKNGMRIGLTKEEDQLAWLHRKANEAGFRLLSVTTIPEEVSKSRSTRRAALPHEDSATAEPGVVLTPVSARSRTHLAVRFDGVLQIIDPAAFHDAVTAGIGSAKGFGFGLLSLARP